MANIINVVGLNKSYGKKVVLDNVSFEIEEGSIVGLLGPNGCGKTTLIKILTGLIKDHTGTVKIANEEGTSNKILDLRDYAGSGVIGTTSTISNIPSDKYTIQFDMRTTSPNAGMNLVVNNPYHAGLPGFDHGNGLTGYALTFAPGTFVSADESGFLNNVDDAWYTYTIEVDVDKLEGTTLAGTTACGKKFIKTLF